MQNNFHFNRAYSFRKDDYSISSYRTHLQPDVEKFRVSLSTYPLSVHKTLEEAALTVIELIKDPWYFDRNVNVRSKSRAGFTYVPDHMPTSF